jgi:alanyl-tRNA synthetase
MTEPVYYLNPYERHITSTVTDILSYKKGWAVELDRTIFYPEGGGQPGDRGRIGTSLIETTIKEKGRILHLAAARPELSIGDQVETELDWDFRYDYMQQHTGQHLLSGAFYNLLGIGTISVHQGQEYTTIDFDRKEIADDEILQIEREVERQIRENTPVHYREVTEKDAQSLALRREPKVSGNIRVVEIKGFDRVACGGIHLNRTGELQVIHCIGTEMVRGSVRTFWKIGDRALEDYRMKDQQVRTLVSLLSAKPDSVAVQVETKLEQLRELQAQCREAEKLMAKMLLDWEFDQVDAGQRAVITLDLTGYPEGILKAITAEVSEREGFALCAVQNVDDGKIRWVIAVSPEITRDFSPFKEHLFPIISAKGGGRPPLWQGAGTKSERAQDFLESFVLMMKQK